MTEFKTDRNKYLKSERAVQAFLGVGGGVESVWGALWDKVISVSSLWKWLAAGYCP